MSAQALEREAGAPDPIQQWLSSNPLSEHLQKPSDKLSFLVLPLAREVARVAGTDVPSCTPDDLILQVSGMMVEVIFAKYAPANNREYRLACIAAEEGDPVRTDELLANQPKGPISRPIQAVAHVTKAIELAGGVDRVGVTQESEKQLHTGIRLFAEEMVSRGLVTPASVPAA